MKERQTIPGSITLKMRKGTDEDSYVAFLRQTPGFESVEQVFPSDRDPEIRAIHVMNVDPRRVDEAIASLLGSGRVQYANKTPVRRALS